MIALVLVAPLSAAASDGPSAPAVQPTCDDSWINAAGGAWETGANWSTNAPPTSGQYACITTALSAPVVLSSSPTIAGLTLGGTSGTAVLEGDGAGTLTLGGDSTIAETGTLTILHGALIVHQTGTLTNDGTIAPASAWMQFVGSLTNAPDGLISVGSANFYFDGPGTLTNEGELSVTGGASLVSPWAGGSNATIIDAGTIQNTSTSDSTIGAGATLEETSGTTTGIPLQIDGGTLDLEGNGASFFRMVGTSTLTGTVGAAQTIVLDGNIATTGSLTNNGTLTCFQGPHLTVPNGDALTNNGLISLPGANLTMAGDLHNAAAGRISISGATFLEQSPATLTNDGTIAVAPNAALTTTGSAATIDNDGGTIRNGGVVTLSSGGGTFVEGAGTETGNLVTIGSQMLLQLAGGGASGFWINGGTLSGDIAAGQVLQDSNMTATGSFANYGTMYPRGGTTTLPAGATITNHGLIAGTGSVSLNGSLTNAADGVINLQQVIRLLGSNESIVNNGTVYMPCCGGFHIDGASTTNGTFVNTGTYYLGLLTANAWGNQGGGAFASGVQAGSPGDSVTIGGTIVPLPSSEPPTPPGTPNTISYGFTSQPGTNPPPAWTLSCGYSVGHSNWAPNCTANGGARIDDGSDTSLTPTQTTVSGSGTCNQNNSCHSTYGQPVTITATVSSEYGVAPTGTVTILADLVNEPFPNARPPAYSLGTVPLSTTNGVTTGSVTTQLPPGDFQLSAIYNGDSSHLLSAALYTTYQEQIVVQPTTTAALSSAPASPVFGQPVTLTATITPSQAGGADPTGSVRFGLGSSQFPLGEAQVVTANGVTTATLTTTAIPEGTYTVYAAYSGDLNYGSSNLASTSVTEAAPTAPTTLNVTGPSVVTPGKTYTATATTEATGAVLFAVASDPTAPQGLSIGNDGIVRFAVPSTGLKQFSYAVVSANAVGRMLSSTVRVAVSKGCIVPALKGLTLAAAKTALKGAQCALGTVTRAYSAQTKGTVIKQSPRAGTHETKGYPVSVTVSKGPKPGT